MCGSSPPSAPDYTPISNAMISNAQSEMQAMQEQLKQQQSQFDTTNTEQQQQYQQALAASTSQAAQNTDLEKQQLALEQASQASTSALSQQQLDAYQSAQSQANSIAAQNAAAYSSVAASEVATQNFELGVAKQTFGDWTQNIEPLIGQYSSEAANYDSPANEALNSGQAVAATSQSYDSARLGSLQNLESYGVDPTSTRYAALDIGMRTGEAAAEAAAGTQSTINTRNTGLSLMGSAIQLGNELPGMSNSAASNAIGAGSAATGALSSGVNSAQEVASGTAGGVGTISGAGLSSINADNSILQGELGAGAANQNLLGSTQGWMQQGLQSLGMTDNLATSLGGLSNSSYGGATNAINTGFQNSLGSWNANQQAGSGIGSLVGTAAGIGAMAFMEHGGAVPAPHDIRSGGAVPAGMSPTRGAAVDDVAMRANVGEFVTPKDVVSWKGEEFFHKLITKAREEREAATQQSGAVPVIKSVATPQHAALPV